MFRNNIFLEKRKKKEDEIFDSDTRVSSPAHFFSPPVQQTFTEEEKKPASDEFCKEICPKCLDWQTRSKGSISHLFSDFCYFPAEKPRTINHPKTLKMFDLKMSEHVVKAVLY